MTRGGPGPATSTDISPSLLGSSLVARRPVLVIFISTQVLRAAAPRCPGSWPWGASPSRGARPVVPRLPSAGENQNFTVVLKWYWCREVRGLTPPEVHKRSLSFGRQHNGKGS